MWHTAGEPSNQVNLHNTPYLLVLLRANLISYKPEKLTYSEVIRVNQFTIDQ